MAYKVIVDFKDLMGDHSYKAGDIYPATGSADPVRVKQLITPTSQRGPLIEEFVEPKRKSREKKEE